MERIGSLLSGIKLPETFVRPVSSSNWQSEGLHPARRPRMEPATLDQHERSKMRSTDFAPLRFRERRLDAYQPVTSSAKRGLEAARRFVSGELGSLVLAGPTGVAKTHLAV